MNITSAKYCSKCKSHKMRDQFSKNWQTRDGLNSWCKLCHKGHRIARQNSQTVGSESATGASEAVNTPSARCS